MDWDDAYTVVAVPPYKFTGVSQYGTLQYDPLVPIENQILFALELDDVTLQASSGTLTYDPTCSWIDAQDVLDWLGISVATAGDEAFVDLCAQSANDFCFKRRQEAGYQDKLDTLPSTAVGLGTRMYAGFLYRQRGAVTDFSGFDSMSAGSSQGLNAAVKQLLGIDRPQCA
jgi:hypothetical protein